MRLLTIAILLGATFGLFAAASDPLEILVLYDNTSIQTGVQADWGFAALVTFRGEKVLFDSGTKPDILLSNMKALAVDPAGIRHAVISHGHGDHLLGIYKVFPSNPSMKVYFLDAFPDPAFRNAEAIGMRPQRVRAPIKIVDGIYSTGPVDGNPPEQALVIETAKGLVVLTGCSHPGVVKMVEAAEQQRGAKSVRFLLGGFHMLQQGEAEATQNIERLRALGVASVAATHCTGDLAMRLFAKAYGPQSVTAGAGKRFVLD